MEPMFSMLEFFYIVGFIDVDNNIGNFIASFSIFSFSFLVIAEIVFSC